MLFLCPLDTVTIEVGKVWGNGGTLRDYSSLPGSFPHRFEKSAATRMPPGPSSRCSQLSCSGSCPPSGYIFHACHTWYPFGVNGNLLRPQEHLWFFESIRLISQSTPTPEIQHHSGTASIQQYSAMTCHQNHEILGRMGCIRIFALLGWPMAQWPTSLQAFDQ